MIIELPDNKGVLNPSFIGHVSEVRSAGTLNDLRSYFSIRLTNVRTSILFERRYGIPMSTTNFHAKEYYELVSMRDQIFSQWEQALLGKINEEEYYG